jgi:hypothetical protein
MLDKSFGLLFYLRKPKDYQKNDVPIYLRKTKTANTKYIMKVFVSESFCLLEGKTVLVYRLSIAMLPFQTSMRSSTSGCSKYFAAISA